MRTSFFATAAIAASLTSPFIAKPVAAVPLLTDFDASFFSRDILEWEKLHVAADLNGDGRLDAVVLRERAPIPYAQTYFMQANGSFLAGPQSILPDPPQSEGFIFPSDYVSPARDYSGDGKIDLLVIKPDLDLTGEKLVAVLGDGNGGFSGVRTLVEGGFSIGRAGIGEFTGDGLIDVVVTRGGTPFQTYELALFAGTPAGPFTFVQSFTAGIQTSSLRVLTGDFTGDGRDDIVWTRDQTLQLYRGQPGGGLAAPLTIALPEEASALGTGDFNGDGLADLVTSSANVSGVRIAYGAGGGAFEAPVFVPTTVPVTETLQRIQTGDVNDDGKDDLLYVSGGGVFEQPIDGTGTVAARFALGRANLTAFMPADFDGDSRDDLMMTSRQGALFEDIDHLSVALHTYDAGPATLETATAAGPGSLVLGDLDRDGHLDAVTTNLGVDQVTILWGNGAGGFAARTDLSTGDGPQAAAIGLLDNDAFPDLIVTNETGGNVAVHRGLGSRSFATPTFTPVAPHARGAALGDLNADGMPDVAVVLDNANKIALLYGDGTGNLSAPALLTSGSSPCAPHVIDVNRDGRTDLVYGLRVSNAVVVRYGQPGGALGPETVGPGAQKVTHLAVLDVNGDGQLDIASVGDESNACTIVTTDGAGGMSFHSLVALSQLADLATADFDGDGDQDLALAQGNISNANTSGVVGVVESFSPNNSLLTAPLWAAMPTTSALASGDMNGDGRPDLVLASKGRSSVGVILNEHTGTIVDAGGPAPPARPGILFAGPNPTRGAFSIRYVAPGDVAGVLAIVSLRGGIVERLGLDAGPAGERTVRVTPQAPLAPGVYWVDVQQGALREARKIVVVP